MNKVPDWYVKDIVELIRERRNNEYDANIAVSGNRGLGKSTVSFKTLVRFKGFDPWKHQVYNRDDVMNLLKNQQRGYCFDDEAINSSYKREFQNKIQRDLIKFLTAYRDRFNVFFSVIPNFFSLDKDLRDLFFMHIQVLERGIALIHMPVSGRLYSQDRWDSKYNAKIEETWSKRRQQDPTFRPPYQRLTTCVGYLYWNDLTPKQRKLYLTVKSAKRQESFLTVEEQNAEKEVSFLQRVYNLLLEGKLTKEGIVQMCLVEGTKYSSISSRINQMLTDNGITNTMKDFLKSQNKGLIHNNTQEEISKIVPSF